jgi:glycosyltransferase involved in cell wall biosynthesis
MLRILHHVKFHASIPGGVERVVEELVPELNRFPDLEVDVLCQGTTDREFTLPGKGRVFQRRASFKISTASMSIGDFRQWLRVRHLYHVVHIHAPWPQSTFNLLAAETSASVLVHWHSDIARQRFLYAGYRILERAMLRRADKICVTSPKLLAESTGLEGFREKATVVPIGIRDFSLPEGPRAESTSQIRSRFYGKSMIFSLGRLVAYKGFEYLIKAGKLLKSNCVVLIAGDGPLRQRLEGFVEELGLHGKVVLLGQLSSDEVLNYMSACDVYCLPSVSKTEAFGIVQIEAMRAGRPIVSTRLHGSGIDWVNQDGITGLTVPPEDEHALATALDRILGDPATLKRLGTAGRRRYEQHFTAAGVASQMRDVYRSLKRPTR